MNCDEGAYFLSHVYDPLLTSLDDHKTGSQMQRRSHCEEVCCPRRTNCQVSVNFNLVLFGRKFISISIHEPDEFVQ